EGRAELKHLSAEAIQYLIVNKPGYEVERIDNFLEGDSVEIELTSCPLTKGTVVDHLGKPVAGAKVYHAGVSSGYDIIKDRADLKTIAITDQDGNFETNVLSKKNLHTLLVETKNLRSLRGNIAAGKQTKMQMAKPHSINVRFTGDLIAGQEIDFFVRQEIDLGASRTASIDLPPQDSIKTDKQRSFVLRGVLPGSLSIGSLYFSSEIKPDTKEIVIDLDKFTKTMKRTIQLSFADDNETVIPKGVIRIGGRRTEIIDGIAKFEVNSDSQIALSSEGMIGYRIAKEDHGFYIIELAPKLDKVTVGVKPAGVIKGVVTDFKGEPISTTVRCKYSFIDRNISPFPTDIEVLSNKNGQFVFTPIPLGVKAELRTDYIQRSPLKMVTVAKDSPIVTADLRTPETGTATVSVKLESGEPALGAKVKLISASKGSTHTLQKNLQKNGEAILEAVPVEPESGTELSVSIMPRPGFQIPPSQPIKVGDELEFVIQVGHRLTGRVVDTDGNPVKELVVQAHFENKFVSADELTNANGEFLFTRLPDKEVALQARHRWEKLKSEFSKKVTPDSEVPVLLTVKKHE
ncbi:MAG: hypothetical protein AB8B55_21970, partial [Mariniblastus sp.]